MFKALKVIVKETENITENVNKKMLCTSLSSLLKKLFL